MINEYLMEEVIKYFESLESRIAAQEALRESLESRIAAAEQSLAAAEERLAAQEETISALRAQVEELQNRPLPEPQVVEKVVEKIVEKPVVVAAPVAEPEPVVEDAPKVEEPEVIAEPEPEPVAEPEPEKPEVPEKPEEPEPAPVVEEQASPKAAIYGKAVDDIRLAISLGDRFLYQRELFGQNAELMQKTLTELNALHSFDEAMGYISRLGWDTESNSYQQFIVTLHRRFG